MPRRVPDYPDSYEGWNFIASIGSNISAFSTILFFYIVFDIFYTKRSIPTIAEESVRV